MTDGDDEGDGYETGDGGNGGSRRCGIYLQRLCRFSGSGSHPLQEAWNVMSPEGLALAHELAGQHLVGVPQVDRDGDGEITRVEFLDRCVAGDIKVVVDFPCYR